MKYLAALVIAMMVTASAYADPFMTCDPQEGVEFYRFEFAAIPLTFVSPAVLATGEMNYDLGLWTGPQGWHDGEASACGNYELEDPTSGETTTAEECSDPSQFRLKIPKYGTAANFILR